MALYIPWLADAARLPGYPVVEVPGWRSLGHGGLRVCETVTGHHTANPQRGDYPSLNIVRNGRGDLAGPLSQLGLARSGTVYIIAAGLAYQAGASAWAGFTDLNDEGIGIEAESAGTVDDWTPEQRDCYPRLVAALLYYMRRGPERFGFHKEVCRPHGRKIDAAYWDGNATRRRIEWLLADPLHRIPRFASPDLPPVQLVAQRRTTTEDHEMYLTTAPGPGNDKSKWPNQRVSIGFDPKGGWGGNVALNLHFGFPGGWVHEAKWWVRGGTGVGEVNKPHSPAPIDIGKGGYGQERSGGMGLQLTPPDRADELEILLSAPGGVHIFPVYEK